MQISSSVFRRVGKYGSSISLSLNRTAGLNFTIILLIIRDLKLLE